jgi:hypothetical protein
VLGVNQLGLFGEAPPSRRRPAAVEPARPALPPGWAESVEQYDDGPTAALYSAMGPNPHFGDWIRAWLDVRVERLLGHRPVTWMARVDLELPDAERTHWRTYTIFATRGEAAAEAADMLAAARAVLDACLRGDPVETPGDRRQRAAEAHAEATGEYKAAVQRADVLRAVMHELDPGSSEAVAARSRWYAARDAAKDVWAREADAFYAAHGWREFL